MGAQEGHHECLSILLAHGAEVDKANAVSFHGVCGISLIYGMQLVLELLLNACVVTFIASAVNYRMVTQL